MSLKLRVKYKFRSALSFFASFYIPSFFYGTTARVSLLGFVVVVTLGYLMQTSALSAGGYEINTLENKISILHNDLRKLDTEVAMNQSLTNIDKRLKDSNMVAVDKTSVVKLTSESAVAKR